MDNNSHNNNDIGDAWVEASCIMFAEDFYNDEELITDQQRHEQWFRYTVYDWHQENDDEARVEEEESTILMSDSDSDSDTDSDSDSNSDSNVHEHNNNNNNNNNSISPSRIIPYDLVYYPIEHWTNQNIENVCYELGNLMNRSLLFRHKEILIGHLLLNIEELTNEMRERRSIERTSDYKREETRITATTTTDSMTIIRTVLPEGDLSSILNDSRSQINFLINILITILCEIEPYHMTYTIHSIPLKSYHMAYMERNVQFKRQMLQQRNYIYPETSKIIKFLRLYNKFVNHINGSRYTNQPTASSSHHHYTSLPSPSPSPNTNTNTNMYMQKIFFSGSKYEDICTKLDFS